MRMVLQLWLYKLIFGGYLTTRPQFSQQNWQTIALVYIRQVYVRSWKLRSQKISQMSGDMADRNEVARLVGSMVGTAHIYKMNVARCIWNRSKPIAWMSHYLQLRWRTWRVSYLRVMKPRSDVWEKAHHSSSVNPQCTNIVLCTQSHKIASYVNTGFMVDHAAVITSAYNGQTWSIENIFLISYKRQNSRWAIRVIRVRRPSCLQLHTYACQELSKSATVRKSYSP